MGREVRKVPANWEHPKDDRGQFIPLYGRSFSEKASNWDKEHAKWQEGFRSDFAGGWEEKDEGDASMSYEDYAGPRPVESDYMPDWPESERTHFQMYEDTSEGTPISPPMESPETLARWLADNGASAFAGQKATYEQWLSTCRSGWAPSAVMSPSTGMVSGVAAMSEMRATKQ